MRPRRGQDPGAAMRVLIAHANEVTRGRLADVVTRGRRLSLDILQSGDGPDTLDLLLADDPPEVALVDWDLPGIEAPEMCRLVRDFHQHHDTWIIVLAPPAHQESASDVWRAGADDCVYTPAPAKLLSDRVTKGLCEMAPPIREAAAAALAAARAAEEAATSAAAAHPTLDAVCRSDDEVCEDDLSRPQRRPQGHSGRRGLRRTGRACSRAGHALRTRRPGRDRRGAARQGLARRGARPPVI